jgi:TM2 domain-containing membrane protein YozV
MSASISQPIPTPKNKTLAAFLAAFGGSLGLHRFYLKGLSDWVGWLHVALSMVGWWGVERIRTYGQDDQLSWVLVPFLGISLAVACLTAVIDALATPERWNARHNPELDPEHPAGVSHGLTIAVLIFALLAGTIAFMSSLAFSFQHYFEYQIDEAQKISQ